MSNNIKIMEELNNIENIFRDQKNKNINKKIDDVNKNELFKQIHRAFDVHTTSDWDKNLTNAIKPKFREDKNRQYSILVLGRTEFPLTFEKLNNSAYINLPNKEKILYSENVMNLIRGQPLDATNDLLELRNYAKILKAARAKRTKDGRFSKLEEKILNLDNTNQYIEDDISGLELQGDPSGVKRRETRSLDGISDRTTDRTTDIFYVIYQEIQLEMA